MAASPRSDSLRRSLPLFEQTLGLEGLEDSEWPSHLALSMHSRKSPDQSPHRFSFCLGPALRGLDRVAATTCLGAFPLWCTVARLTRTATALLSTTTVSSMNLGWSGAISMSPATVGAKVGAARAHPVATVNSRPWPLHAFLCKGYLYSLHHILSGPSIFSRIFSNIENILTSRRSTETKSRSQTRSEPPKLKDFSRHRPETYC